MLSSDEVQQPNSPILTEQVDSPTIGARPVRAEKVVGPIRRRFRGAQTVWYVLGVVEFLLLLRLFLKFIGAAETAGFTQFVYTVSFPFAGPFVNVVGPSRFDKSVFEWSMLLAMFVYALIAWGVVKILVMSRPVSDAEANTGLDDQK